VAVPPVVHYRLADGPAYLIAWVRRRDGWWAHLLWLTQVKGLLKGMEAMAIALDVQSIPGQSYGNVPRRREWAGPLDTSDPRDPYSLKRGEERALLDRRVPRPPEPDF
jgi:hypothetical protein